MECGFKSSAQELFANVGEDSRCVSLGAMGACDPRILKTINFGTHVLVLTIDNSSSVGTYGLKFLTQALEDLAGMRKRKSTLKRVDVSFAML